MPDRWTAFDPRTGASTWSIPNPVRCPDGPVAPLENLYLRLPYYVVDGANTLMTINDCSTPDRIVIRETAADPATGKVLRERMVPGLDTADAPSAARRWYAGPQGRDGYTATVTWRDRRPDLDLFVDGPTGRHFDMGEASIEARSPADGGFLVNSGSTYRQYSGAGEFVCELSLATPRYVETVLLTDQIVEVDRTDPQRPMVRVFDRSNCQERATIPAPFDPGRGQSLRVYLVPGVLLFVVEQGGGNGTLHGFTS
ncbi:hypothetical protein MARA_02860 (plasmid) [Mycolicibacterium arabiense]|uniref:Uncharacterized protein n=2 Tax=Mycolicibacterium arabiense TaxID=1286181 RepID=A0A7I7RS42_9MYCO|nr:hypothetical protein MARA_02860 [Mycolicibacterium arabiense]